VKRGLLFSRPYICLVVTSLKKTKAIENEFPIALIVLGIAKD
jgi:hypothetical protein